MIEILIVRCSRPYKGSNLSVSFIASLIPSATLTTGTAPVYGMQIRFAQTRDAVRLETGALMLRGYVVAGKLLLFNTGVLAARTRGWSRSVYGYFSRASLLYLTLRNRRSIRSFFSKNQTFFSYLSTLTGRPIGMFQHTFVSDPHGLIRLPTLQAVS